MMITLAVIMILLIIQIIVVMTMLISTGALHRVLGLLQSEAVLRGNHLSNTKLFNAGFPQNWRMM